MRAQIDRHVIDPDGEVGAVIEIVAAQKILVSFALAAVLRDDEPRIGLKHLPWTRNRARVDLLTSEGLLAGHGLRRDKSSSCIRASRCWRRSRGLGRNTVLRFFGLLPGGGRSRFAHSSRCLFGGVRANYNLDGRKLYGSARHAIRLSACSLHIKKRRNSKNGAAKYPQ